MDGTDRVIPSPEIHVTCHARVGVQSGGSSRGVAAPRLRHTFATLLLNNGVEMKVVSEFLGHSLAATTNRYAHLLTETKKAAILKVGRTLPRVAGVS